MSGFSRVNSANRRRNIQPRRTRPIFRHQNLRAFFLQGRTAGGSILLMRTVDLQEGIPGLPMFISHQLNIKGGTDCGNNIK